MIAHQDVPHHSTGTWKKKERHWEWRIRKKTEILVCRMEELTDVVTLPILVRHTDKDETLNKMKEDVKKGSLRKELRDKGYKECFA